MTGTVYNIVSSSYLSEIFNAVATLLLTMATKLNIINKAGDSHGVGVRRHHGISDI